MVVPFWAVITMLNGELVPEVGEKVFATPLVSAAPLNVALANGLVNVGVNEIEETVPDTETV